MAAEDMPEPSEKMKSRREQLLAIIDKLESARGFLKAHFDFGVNGGSTGMIETRGRSP